MQKLFCINTKNTQKHAHAQPIFRFFFYNYKRNVYEQLQFYLVKNRNSQITNKNEINEKKGKRTKKRKTNEKKKKCNKDILSMYEKVYSFNIKYHANVIFLTTFFLFFVIFRNFRYFRYFSFFSLSFVTFRYFRHAE